MRYSREEKRYPEELSRAQKGPDHGVGVDPSLLSYGDPPALTHFSGFCRQRSPQRGVHSVVNMGGTVETLRRSNSLSRSIFSAAGSFGNMVVSNLVVWEKVKSIAF